MAKTLYKVIWTVSILLVAAILCSSVFMFINGGGADLELLKIYLKENDEETEKETESTQRPSKTEAQTEVPPAPDTPDYPDDDSFYTEGLEFALNEDGQSYSVINGTACKDKKIIIPLKYNGLPVTEIGSYAFYRHDLTDIEFPESVQMIGEYAFMGCENLTYVDLPYYLVTIEKSAFASCTLLETIVVYEHLKSIGAMAFSNCTSLKNIDFWGKNWNDIEKGAGWDSGCNYTISKG